MKHSILLSIAFIIAFSNICMGMSQMTDQDMDLVADASIPAAISDDDRPASDMILDAYNDWKSHGIGSALYARSNEAGFYIGFSQAPISVSPDNDEWAKYRVMAYERAYVMALSDYMNFLFQKIVTEDVYQSFADSNLDKPEFDHGASGRLSEKQIESIIKKFLAVQEGKLDKQLEDLGIDPGEYQKLPEKQKKTLLQESLLKTTVRKSASRLAGVIPVKTFEGTDSSGNMNIGVVIVASNNLRQFAHEIMHRRGQLERSNSQRSPLIQQVQNGGNEALMQSFGVRKLYDENGYPCLVSFGQFSVGKNVPSGRMANRYRDVAFKQAESLADSAIVNYLNSHGNYSSESIVEEALESMWQVHHDNFAELLDTSKVVDIFSEYFRQKGTVNVSGLKTLHKWSHAHPENGHTIVGVVRAWTPSQEQSAVESRTWQPDQPQRGSKPKKKETRSAPSVKESLDYSDVHDF